MCNPVSDRAEANKRITMQINVECLPDVCIEQLGRDCGKIKERRKRNFHSMSLDMLLSTIQTQAVARLFRVTDHAREEMFIYLLYLNGRVQQRGEPNEMQYYGLYR